jgi:hypothetical protein
MEAGGCKLSMCSMPGEELGWHATQSPNRLVCACGTVLTAVARQAAWMCVLKAAEPHCIGKTGICGSFWWLSKAIGGEESWTRKAEQDLNELRGSSISTTAWAVPGKIACPCYQSKCAVYTGKEYRWWHVTGATGGSWSEPVLRSRPCTAGATAYAAARWLVWRAAGLTACGQATESPAASWSSTR